MYAARSLESDRRRTCWTRVGEDLSYADVVRLWIEEDAFADFCSELLASAPWPALFFETRPVCTADADERFEHVLLESTALAAMPAEPQAFEQYFASSSCVDGVVTFENLAGDALLVAPAPAAELDGTHLAAFLRSAVNNRRRALWRAVGRALATELGSAPRWLSTSGLGVGWTHVRIDKRPKYYQFTPYRQDPSAGHNA